MTEQESLLAAIYEEVKLHPYSPLWPHAFELERERLQSLLPGAFIAIEHIGSTAVFGMPAKPIVDLMASVESMSAAESIAARICASGYTTSVEFNAAQLDRKWFMRSANGHRTHHLHLITHDSTVWREHVRFRDALRAHPALASSYSALKRELAEKHTTDREAYTEAKAEFVRWALSEG